MTKFVLWRVAQLPLIIAVIYLITFLLAWVAPGSPFDQPDRKMDPIAKQQLEAQFHATHWYTFLGYYPWRMVHGDLGPSMVYKGWSVNDVMKASLPVSVTLGIFAMAIALIFGSFIGALAAVKRGGFYDYASLLVALAGVSLPGFVVAGVLISIFSDKLGWLPSGGWGKFEDMILPAFALALMPLAYIARLTRAGMIDVLGADYVRTARAKGLSRAAVIWKHCFRNAFLPVFSYLGPAAAATLTGSFVVEKVFNLPGIGQHFVNSVLNRDQTMILGTVMIYSIFLLTFNLLVDIGYVFIDPRIDVTAEN
ncbi:MAG TPA: ABC transporter permease [Tepidisphaeraceae bacterium]|nr:ABC transporter permease [Tepidisphaeraceae bacterium]